MRKKNLILFALIALTVTGRCLHAEVTVGALSELSGPSAPNGRACRLGYRAAQLYHSEEKNAQARKLNIIYGDHRGEVKTALSEFEKLTKVQHAAAVISNRGHIGMALDPISQKNRIPLLGIMGHTDFIVNNSYGFRFWPAPSQEGGALAKAVFALGHRRAAVVVLHDDYILSLADHFKKEFQKRGGEIVYFDTIEKDYADFNSIISKIGGSKPDVIFVNGAVTQLGVIIRKIREQGLQQQLISNFWISYEDVIQSAGKKNIDGALYVGVDLNKSKFRSALLKVGREEEPSMVTYACFSAVAAVYDVLRKNENIDDAQSLFEALRKAEMISLPDEDVRLVGREVHYNLVPLEIGSGQAS